jgi:hypothetical protein
MHDNSSATGPHRLAAGPSGDGAPRLPLRRPARCAMASRSSPPAVVPWWPEQSRHAYLDGWCRRQQRTFPSLFTLRIPPAPPTGPPVSASPHPDGSATRTISGRPVAFCDGCAGLVALPPGTTIDSPPPSAVCRACGFATAQCPAARRLLGLRTLSAGLTLAPDVATLIVLEARGILDLRTPPRSPPQPGARALSLRRRIHAAQALLDAIGVPGERLGVEQQPTVGSGHCASAES